MWSFCKQCEIPSIVFGNSHGIAISADGADIAGELDGTIYFFKKESNKPLWAANIESGSIGLDMSDDGSVISAGTGNSGPKGDKIFIFDKEGQKSGSTGLLIRDMNNQAIFISPMLLQTANMLLPPRGARIEGRIYSPGRENYYLGANRLLSIPQYINQKFPMTEA